MIKLDTISIITGIVSEVLHGQHRTGEWKEDFSKVQDGLLFELSMVVQERDNVETGQRRGYYVAFCGNTSVYWTRMEDAEGNHRQFEDIPSDEWENSSNHDSCWRSDGLHWVTEEYFDLCKSVNPKIAPRDLDSYAQLGFISLWRKVKIHDKSSDNYCRQLLSIKRV